MWTRRNAIKLAALAPVSGVDARAAPWTSEWDRAVLSRALIALDELYDAGARMLMREIGPRYQYHTNLRSTVAHPVRESLEYALYLLEDGADARRKRAEETLDRVLALQDTDLASKWYGLWGWYLEEPPPRMSPADWNWADFNGATLLMIANRHGGDLPENLRERVHQAIRHAAYSVRRRNVRMGYTNIAVKGTFVTLAAAELLGFGDLQTYARERMLRLARYIDETGSFDEYNSPTYTRVMIADLTRLRMVVRNMEMKRIADRIHERAWLHFAKHWHAGTRQLAGPMSRCYRNDIGAPLWLQKALGGRLEFASLDEARASGEVTVLDLECPKPLRRCFLEPGGERQHRELFINAEPPESPLQGTTFLAPEFCLGSANKSDFWSQRRGLLAYWGGPARPARWLQLRLLKDDYDFASGVFLSVQERNSVLGLVNFRSPGGDRHISLEPIENGTFECSRLRVRAGLAGVPESARLLIDGKEANLPAGGLLPGSRVSLDLGGTYLWLRFPRAVFGDNEPHLSIDREEGLLTISLDLHRTAEPSTVRWSEVREAWAALNLVMDTPGETLADFSLRCSMGHLEPRRSEDKVRLIWESPNGRLWLEGLAGVTDVRTHHSSYRAGVRSGPVPLERLSGEKLAG